MQKIRTLFAITFLLANTSCTHMFYYPLQAHSGLEKKNDLHVDHGYISTEDGLKISYWYISFKKNQKLIEQKFTKKITGPRGLFLQFHGNAQNMTYHFLNQVWVLEHGYDLMVFDYRGYGASEGQPSPKGTHKDAVAILKFAEKRANKINKPLITYGQSLGGSILLYALAKGYKPKNLQAIVIESSFFSYQDTARHKLSNFWLTWPVQWLAYLLINDKYSPSQADLKQLSPTPLFLLYSKRDPIVAYYNSQLIFNELAEPKTLWSHNVPGHTNGMWVENGKFRNLLMNSL